ncbi:MAG: SDR family NAD(P)-dependent oxidoreductase [Flavitalea sp.]
MNKSILIVGAGPGLSYSVAEKFAGEGFGINLISRNKSNLEVLKRQLSEKGISSSGYNADAASKDELKKAIDFLSASSAFDVVLYNVAVIKERDIMKEEPDDLTREFHINVAGALSTIQLTYQGLKHKHGAYLLSGGGLAVNPMAAYGSLSIGKAGIRSLAYQLHDRLKDDGIYVGLLTIAGLIDPESKTHSPLVLANLFWKMYNERTAVELHQ